MKKNMGTVDRVGRLSIAVLIGILYALDVITGTTAIVLGILAVVFALTSLMGFCPLYLPLGLSTNRKKNPD